DGARKHRLTVVVPGDPAPDLAAAEREVEVDVVDRRRPRDRDRRRAREVGRELVRVVAAVPLEDVPRRLSADQPLAGVEPRDLVVAVDVGQRDERGVEVAEEIAGRYPL